MDAHFMTMVSWLVGFYGISTIVGYLMPKSCLYINIEYVIYAQLNDPTVLFLTIQFRISQQC